MHWFRFDLSFLTQQRLRPIVWACLFTPFFFLPDSIQGQSAGQWGICEFSTLSQLTAFSPGADDWACKIAYVNATHDHYEWDGSNWNQISTLNIYEANSSLTADRTLNLGDYSLTFSGLKNIHISPDGYLGIGTITPDARLDVEGGSVRFSDYGSGDESGTPTYQLAVDADGDLIEVNTAKSAGIFYPPAIALDASSTDTELTLDLHQEYQDRFGSPSVASSGAPSAIPSYGETELYYYVTDYDSAVLANISISSTGVMTYDVIATPASSCTILNVVFVVK